MRISHLRLESYGHLCDVELDLSVPQAGLTIVVGPNEAGKSTTTRAIRSLLFGIQRSSRDGYRTGREGMRIGARVIRADGTTLDVVRQGLARAPLVDADGAAIDPASWSAALGGADVDLFSNLFCIDHRELHERSSDLLDADGDIGRLAFGASLGAVALADALRSLDQRAAELFRPRGSTQRVHKALTAYRDLIGQARRHRVLSRDWEQAERELDARRQDVDGLSAERAELAGRRARLERIGGALSPLRRRAGALGARTGIAADGPVGSATWAQDVTAAIAATDAAARGAREADRECARLRSRLEGLTVPDGLIGRSADIDRLVEGTERYRKDLRDLPRVRGELELRRQEVDGILERLGMTDATARGITDAQLADVERLAHTHVALAEGLRQSERQLAEAVRDTEAARATLDRIADARDVRALEAAVAGARARLEGEAALVELEATATRLGEDAVIGARRLGLGEREPAAIEALAVPTHAVVIAARDRRARLIRDVEQVTRRRVEISDRIHALEAERLELSERPGTPDAAELEAARTRREAGWDRVRAVWLEAPAPEGDAEWPPDPAALASAYASSVTAADVAADRRFQHADDVTRLAAIGRELARLVDDDARSLVRARDLADEHAEIDGAWAAIWTGVGVEPASPDAALEWLQEFRGVLEVARRFREAAAAATALGGEAAAAAHLVSRELVRLGESPLGTGLAMLVGQATDVVRAEADLERRRHDARRAIEQHAAATRRRTAEHESNVAAQRSWGVQWAAALVPLGLSDASADAGQAVVGGLREFRAKRDDAAGLERRVDGIHRDLSTYRASVDGVAASLLGPPRPEDPLSAVDAMRRDLQDARSVADARRAIAEELDGALERHRIAVDAVNDARARRAELASIGGLASGDDLAAAAERSLRLAALDDTLAACEAELIVLGRGRSVADLDAEAGEFGHDSDRVDAEQRMADDAIADVTVRIDEANRRLGDARTRFGAIDGSAEAAVLEQDGEIVLAGLASDVREYVETALAAAILRAAIADYGATHQGPILEQASRYFRTLTRGAFPRLSIDLADVGTTVLLAERANGETLHVADLSDGTVDQLYLALRLAGLEHHLEHAAEPLPVILDDLLVNFDDERAGAALEALAALGDRTQTVLFTHHRRIAELAAAVLPPDRLSVVSLPARDHDTRAAVPDPAPARRDATVAPNGGYEEAILAALGAIDRPVGKSELVARGDVPAAAWTGAIRRLVERGVVVQTGEKRGARYELATRN